MTAFAFVPEKNNKEIFFTKIIMLKVEKKEIRSNI